MLQKVFLFIIISLTLVACGGKKSKQETSASFQLFVGAVSDPNLAGGVIVYGREAAGATFAINVTSDTLSFPIPNGSWNFYAFGWSGPNNLEGTLRCGETSAQLDGGDAVVSFTLNDANCANGNYGAANFKIANQFKPIRMVHCTDLTGVANGTSDCNGVLSSTASYQIELATFSEAGSDPLQAVCLDDAGNVGGNTNSTITVPTGGFFADFLSLRIKTFKQASCGGSPSAVYNFNSGIEGGASNTVVYDDTGHSVIFVDAPATIVVPGIALNPSSNHTKEITNANYKLKNVGVGLVIKEQTISNASYKVKSNRKAEVTKPRFTESTSTNYKLHVGTK